MAGVAGTAVASGANLAAAAAHYREALRHAPGSAAAHTGLGRALYLSGDLAAATAHLSSAVALDRYSGEANRLLRLATARAGGARGGSPALPVR
jgi:tetratricopeptide (TPR) repeat protein